MPFYNSPTYATAILKGLITSSGGLTESTLKASSDSLFKYLSNLQGNLEEKKMFLSNIIIIFKESIGDERVTVPLMKTLEMLLESDYLNEEGLIDKISELHALTVQECNKSKNIPKLMSGAGVFTGMLGLNNKELARKCTKTLMFLLYHSFPKVRKHTADKLYTQLLSLEDSSIVFDSEEQCEAA